jgi:hypothetical protein
LQLVAVGMTQPLTEISRPLSRTEKLAIFVYRLSENPESLNFLEL